MRWFKHLTASCRDEKLMQIQEQFGLEGYGLFWLILEIIAEKMTKEKPPIISFSAKNWSKITGISVKKLKLFLTFSAKLKIFEIKIEKNSPEMITVCCDNLLKYRDEYTSRK